MRHLQCMDHFRPHGHLAMKVAFTFITTVLKKDDIMSVKKVELLAPAGDFACFRAAVNAGADAVYLGGGQYGARAYATNFTAEELQKALRIAHLFGRKIYLTVNTLVKEQEFANLIPYIQPLYETGLDGVIIQDMGVLQCLRENFPKLELHASTQMTVTGIYGAAYLKKLGVCRVVPARELSLDEIQDIKEETGLEVECFVHGAMCYAYSGQCLFSSILGGRSGNRGRCAGPCRLPYMDGSGKKLYPLSLKDMYTLPMLPALIQAGVDSFKIEGRMKSPEYVAGVTAIYRKYLDLYLENPDRPYKVSTKDEQSIRGLYIRSDTCEGYYQRHNDKSMVTLKEPGYSGSAQEILDTVREKYISKDILLPITGTVKIRAGEPAELTFSQAEISVTVKGDLVSPALNRPLTKEDILQKIGKLGDTFFTLTKLTINTDNASFLPVKALNELRRAACFELESQCCDRFKLTVKKRQYRPEVLHCRVNDCERETNVLCVLVVTAEQLLTANSFSEIRRIYVDADLLLKGNLQENCLLPEKEYILVLPYIFRKQSYSYITRYKELIASGSFGGVMVRNFEELEWLNTIGYAGEVYSDYTLYVWNNAALGFLSEQCAQVTLPLELNQKELENLTASSSVALVLYGFLPLMFSANCVKKTLELCIKKTTDTDNRYHLTDRYQNDITIVQNCIHCYNILYNTVPLSLHKQLAHILQKNYQVLRLDFSIEDKRQTSAVIAYYLSQITCPNTDRTAKFPLGEFTNGHYKRGVE